MMGISAIIVGLASLVSVNDTPPPLSYDDAVDCSALTATMAGYLEAEGQTGDAAELEDVATRWLMLAMVREDAQGGNAAEDMPAAAEMLQDRFEALAAEDERALEKLMTDGLTRCSALENANAAEFAAVLDQGGGNEE